MAQPTTYEEIKESIHKNAVATIAKSIKNQYAPFFKHQSAQDFERAYNPSNGSSYEGLNSLMLDTKKAEKEYPSNEWINLKDAEYLGATKEEIDGIKAAWQDKAVKVQYIQTSEFVNVYKKDENGNKIPYLDKDGNQKIGKNGEPCWQCETTPRIGKDGNPIINPQTNEPFYDIKKEKVALPEPRLRTELMYNVAEFPSVAQKLEQVKEVWQKRAQGENVNGSHIQGFNKFKELDKEREYKHIYKNLKDFDKSVTKVILEDIKKDLTPVTAEQITQYFKAQNQGVDYKVPQGLNEKQKEQVENIAKELLQNQKNEKGAQGKEAKAAETKKAEEKKAEAPKQEKEKKAQTQKPKGRGGR